LPFSTTARMPQASGQSRLQVVCRIWVVMADGAGGRAGTGVGLERG